ncbi:MAG: hypothetical protein ACM3W4_00920 [Ignavibacteriales bacterium]
MGEFNPHSLLLIHHIPESRRHRLARVRALALILIGAIAVSGVVLQGRSHPHAGPQLASTQGPFSYFPG